MEGIHMDTKRFDEILDRRIELIKSTLKSKAKEYAQKDRLHNFKLAALLQECSTEEALRGMMAKHWVSVLDIIKGRVELSAKMIDEKIGDSINYLILLEAVLMEQIDDSQKPIKSR
jgi:hypothetical protein